MPAWDTELTWQWLTPSGKFFSWKSVPPAVAVTLSVPFTNWKPVVKAASECSFTLRACIQGTTRHCFTKLQMCFGDLSTLGPRTDDDFEVMIYDDVDE